MTLRAVFPNLFRFVEPLETKLSRNLAAPLIGTNILFHSGLHRLREHDFQDQMRQTDRGGNVWWKIGLQISFRLL